MKILLDENVAQAIKEYLESSGHHVSQVRPTGLSLKNGAVYEKARDSFDLFVTNDRDFLKKSSFPPTINLGIIFLRVSMVRAFLNMGQMNTHQANTHLSKALAQLVPFKKPRSGSRPFGTGKARIRLKAGWNAPLPEKVFKAFGS